ncbi:MAG: PilW family protein [Bdellovibrionales bacterium]
MKEQSGFSLPELMISTAISGIVAIGSTSVFLFTIENFRASVEKNAAEESNLWAQYLTKTFLQQGVEICNDLGSAGAPAANRFGAFSMHDPVGGAILDYGSAGVTGSQIFFDSVAASDAGDDTNYLALGFYREASTGSTSQVVASGIWFGMTDFVYQNENSYLGGTLAFSYGVVGGTTNTVDENVPSIFDRFVRYDLDIDCTNFRARADITTRYYRKASPSEMGFCISEGLETNFNASLNDTNCGAQENYDFVDKYTSVNVTLRNSGITGVGGPHGPLYYFNFIPPPMIIGF